MNSSRSTNGRLIAGTVVLVLAVLSCAVLGYLWGYSSQEFVDRRPAAESAGQSGDLFVVQGSSMAPSLIDGDVCEVDPDAENYLVGDLVVVSWDGQSHVKRIAGLGGDVIDVDRGRLTVNGIRVEDRLAQRQGNWFAAPGVIPVPGKREQWKRSANASKWLVYHHRNPHAGGRATSVMDDYPDNVNVKRILNPVDRLVVRVRPLQGRLSQEFPVAFWIEGTTFRTRTRDGRAAASDASNDPRDEGGAPSLSVLAPVAIEMNESDGDQVEIELHRQIEYRVNGRSEQTRFPLTLSADELFVLGDNVPISVDSRSVGPVARRDVVGKVIGKR